MINPLRISSLQTQARIVSSLLTIAYGAPWELFSPLLAIFSKPLLFLLCSQLHMAHHGGTIEHRELKILEKPMTDSEIKRLMKNLGDSINETLAESPKINECIQDIRDAGYETFLVIEAKIGFSRKDKSDQDKARSDEPVQLRITQDDAKFLKSLRISVDETP
jgi:hypothetical protein